MPASEPTRPEDETAARLRADLAGRRVAVVHDWVTGMRGGEKVLEQLFELIPGADLHTLIYLPGSSNERIEARRVNASWLDRLPGVERYYRWLLPFFPGAIESLDLSSYDLVVSSSHCVAKGALARPDAPHLCYCHTPMRYVWDRFDDYFGHLPPPLRSLIGLEARLLRRWDRETAEQVTGWVANSGFVRGRLAQCYGLDPEEVAVVHPPVDVDRFAAATGSRDDRYLVTSALVPYKRIDLAVEACAVSGRRLDIAGRGPEARRLAEMADRLGAADRIRLLGFVPDADLPELMASRRALLLPGVEDFGITPVEAMAAGLPVVAIGQGGVLDTVEDDRTGVLYGEPTAAALVDALDRFERRGASWEREVLLANARRFAPERFRIGLARRIAALGFGDT